MATKVLVLYNEPQSAADHAEAASEHAVVDHARSQAAVLNKAGYAVELLGLNPDPAFLWHELQRRRPDVILNLYEGTLDDPETETYVAGLLQWSGIPYTGCTVPTLTLTRAKHQTKRVLKTAGLPTADFMVVDREPAPCTLEWPVFVKPATQDASVGIGRESICRNPQQLDDRVRYLLSKYPGPVLVERFLPGREIHVAVTALPEVRSLPPAEVAFAPGNADILTYDAKWDPSSPDYHATPMRFGIELAKDLAAELGRVAVEAFRVLGARDYARVDFRLGDGDRPFILELNPNPEIGVDTCFGRILESAGTTFEVFLARLIEHAKTRGGQARV
jgi:D-alanine-D-alanine ligase